MTGDTSYIPTYESNPDEWISAEEVRKQLGLSPYDFCELLDTNHLQTDRAREQQESWQQPGCSQSPYFDEEEIETLRIHVSYYRSYCEHLGLEKSLLPPRKHTPPNNSLYPLVLAENKKLRTQNTELKARLEELEGQESTSSETPAKARVRDYTERIPEIVKATLFVYEYWKASDEDSQIKKYGFTDGEIEAISGTVKEFRTAIKKALPDQDIKVWLKNNSRPGRQSTYLFLSRRTEIIEQNI